MENGKINAVKDKTGNKFKIAKIILISILLFIITPLILYWIVCTPCPWGWGFIKSEDTGVWTGFYGAVLGGCITFGGVWWTIKNQASIRKEDITIQYKPIILFKRCRASKRYVQDIEIDAEEDTIGIEIYICNVGRGEALNLTVSINDKIKK